MPAVASVPKELYLSSSLKDLNKKTEVKPEKISTKKYVSFASLSHIQVSPTIQESSYEAFCKPKWHKMRKQLLF